jgi:signal transduction histidine kinase/CheY-like chemotaxis protein
MPTHHRRAWLLDLVPGRRDDALRERYATLAVARETGDPGAVAYAQGLLAGALADLYHLEEADRQGAEATALAQRADAFHAHTLAALNHLNALVSLNRGREALPLVQALQLQEPELSPRAREQRCIVYADVYLQSGDGATAQALLDESVRLRGSGSQSLVSWSTAQVACHLACGRLAEARAVGEAWLAHPDPGTDPSDVPSEQLRLLQALSQACEGLGDAAAALNYLRQAFDVHEALVGRSARARRIALEVEHQLDRERWQREQAQLRQQAAEAEGTRLEQMNKALEVANQAKTRFLAAASHDLRQPVQALVMTMAALQGEALTPAQAQLVQRMGQSLSSLGQLFDVLLDISRLDAGVVQVHPQALDLRPLLFRLVDEHQAQARGLGLQVRLVLPPAVRQGQALSCHTDPVLLERCLRNLLDNALKYTRRGGVVLAVRPARAVAAASGAAAWQLVVRDTGLGMTAEVQAQAFDEFYQADNPERDRQRGLGLGLAIVRRLVRLLGHELLLQSWPGRGTRLCLTLAAAEPVPTTAAAPGTPAHRAADHTGRFQDSRPGDLPRSGVRCVAVIDDDAGVRDSLVAVLERWGLRAVAGADPQAVLAAWQVAGRPPVQALLADLRLRGPLTGVQAVASLRQQWGADIPALVITGDVAPDRLQLLRDSGLPWLPKPVMPMRLRSWLAGLG